MRYLALALCLVLAAAAHGASVDVRVIVPGSGGSGTSVSELLTLDGILANGTNNTTQTGAIELSLGPTVMFDTLQSSIGQPITLNADNGFVIVVSGDTLTADTLTSTTSNTSVTISGDGTGGVRVPDLLHADSAIIPDLASETETVSKQVILTGQAGTPAGFTNGSITHDTTRKALMTRTGGITQTSSGVIYRMIASSDTVTNPTGAVTLTYPAGDIGPTGTVTPTIPGGSSANGTRYHVKIAGQISVGTNAGQGVQVRLFMAGHNTVGLSAAIARVNTQTNRGWVIEGDIVVRSTTSQRATGFVIIGSSDNPASATFDTGQYLTNNNAVGHNMAVDAPLEVIASFTVADPNNAVTMTDFILSRD